VEALRKLTIVHNKRHAFTTDSDNNSDEISAEIEQQLRAKTVNQQYPQKITVSELHEVYFFRFCVMFKIKICFVRYRQFQR